MKVSLEVIIRKEKKQFKVYYGSESYDFGFVSGVGDVLANLDTSYLLRVSYVGLSQHELVGVWESWKTYREAL